jgi:HEAT repeat protein
MTVKQEPGFQVPAAEDDLWHQVVVRLLGQRDVDEEQARNHLQFLEELSVHHRICGKSLSRRFTEETATWLAEEMKFANPRDTARAWLTDLENWELLVPRPRGRNTCCEFAVPMLAEYFAARYLARLWTETGHVTWFPSSSGWWGNCGSYRCHMPHCESAWLPFSEMICHPDQMETILMMLGLTQSEACEEVFLSGIPNTHSTFDLKLHALARCHHAHSTVIGDIVRSQRRPANDSFVAVGTARLADNSELIIDHCIEALRDSHLVSHAAFVLGKLKNVRAVEPLIEALKGEYVEPCAEAAWALGEIRDSRAIEPLMTALRDERELVCVAAAETLGDMGVERATDQLIATLGDEDDWVREVAANALVRLGKFAVQPLTRALNSTNAKIRRGATYALGQIQDPRAVPSLVTALADKETREAAAYALRRKGNVAAVEPLLAALTSADPDLRRACVHVLGEIDDTRVCGTLITALRDEDVYVRWAAVDALAGIRETRAIATLLATLSDEDWCVRCSVIRALAQIGDPAVIPPLQALFNDPIDQVRDAAREAIAEIERRTVDAR